METIEVRYKPVKAVPGAYHKYIVYKNRLGIEYVARGGPGGFNVMSLLKKDIVTDFGVYDDTFDDWDPDGTHEREVIATGQDLSRQWRSIAKSMTEIEAAEYPYNEWQTSNGVVDYALHKTGLPAPKLMTGIRARLGNQPGPPNPNEHGLPFLDLLIDGLSKDKAPSPAPQRTNVRHPQPADNLPSRMDFHRAQKKGMPPVKVSGVDPSRTMMGNTVPSTFTHPYPDSQTIFSPSVGPASKFAKPSTPPIPRPRPDMSGALPYAPWSQAATATLDIDDEIAKIERRLRTDRRGYFRDEDMQERYRDLLTRASALIGCCGIVLRPRFAFGGACRACGSPVGRSSS